ncbi:Putative formin, GTPase-binding domain, armadillo-like helical [Septoria linicola]|uniref:Formin, GTPase-binding domain, armadillo-like helical n=1 Tax=Septoria linicola TaxID=215465 RepID=A0A9Q9AWK0_9PEZI|nr:putative formin, GTPase-binding domain, armadillo-like helical [Septoria linicola]USW51986.1 Putative formin, GTPase-binding domain, armadillo-like helical [Septoria linicola]
MADVKQQQQQRPGHRRNASSKSNLLRSLVSSKSRPASPEPTITHAKQPQKVPLLPSDSRGVLGERQNNVQSPPSSPSKNKATLGRSSKDKTKDGKDGPKKSKSSTNLAGVFGRMNRSSKDLSKLVSEEKNKENTSPIEHEPAAAPTPIWAQMASTNVSSESRARPVSREKPSSHDLLAEIDRYTPQEYNASTQRNFNGTFEEPSLRPSLSKPRPQSYHSTNGDGMLGAFGRRVSGGKSSVEGRKSEDSNRVLDRPHNSRVSLERERILAQNGTDRKASGSSAELPAGKEKLNMTKRGGRVMAAVAMFQGKTKDRISSKEKGKEEAPLDPRAVDAQFEEVLAARNIPEPMRQKMRSLTMRVKADFIKQDQGAAKSENHSPPGSITSLEKTSSTHTTTETKVPIKDEDDGKSTKRSRTRSRTFTFSRGKKEQRDDGSPAKKPRSQSRSRPTSIVIPSGNASRTDVTPTTPTGSFGRKTASPAIPGDYIAYLRQNQDPTKVEVGRLHKLRILLRNETVSWVDAFISQDGMHEIIKLLKRTMAIEWREDHEDQLLHESLLCLKGLCTTERAMVELNKFADDLFPALIGMLFDEEKKGPAEYTTRTIIFNVLLTYLSSEMNKSSEELEARARKVLVYLGEPQKEEKERPVDFVLGMHTPRPYKSWSREISNVTREVFWIFLHQLNVVPLPKPSSSHSQNGVDEAERKKILASTYTQRHFPGSRPPVPAAPYIGGVEWDATTYITAHLDLLNGIIASIPDQAARNSLREELQQSGFEKVMGTVLRTCKEKFYSGVHDGLKVWVAAAHEDGWQTRFVREGPSEEEVIEQAMKAQKSPKKSPKKKADLPPKLDALPVEPPKLDLGLDLKITRTNENSGIDDGWLG